MQAFRTSLTGRVNLPDSTQRRKSGFSDGHSTHAKENALGKSVWCRGFECNRPLQQSFLIGPLCETANLHKCLECSLPKRRSPSENCGHGIIAMSSFKLSKWYFDCVTDLGEVVIVYTGVAQWRKFRLHYSSTLETTKEAIIEHRSLQPQIGPVISGPKIWWRSKALRVDGEWETSSRAVSATIYRSPEGVIEWNCLMPMARARIGGRRGLGYAEHLTMTIPPWRLPIHTLRWGRFTSASTWMTWIDWQGEYSRRIVYVNGEVIECQMIGDECIEGSDGVRLSMDRSLVLRDGLLGKTALSRMPVIGKMFPSRLTEMAESKWRSRARMERSGRTDVEGWAIHEKVSWPH